MRATDFVVAAIEIVDSRIEDWKISIVDTVADNASSGMFVLGGPPERLRDVDLRSVEMSMRSTAATSSAPASAQHASGHRSTPSSGWPTRSPNAARRCRPAR